MARPYVVLLTGHPGAGKSTLAPRLARALGAVCLSKDQVRFRVFDGWKQPCPPAGAAAFAEDDVVWSIFFWTVREVAQVAPVVAETAMVKQRNRDDTASFLTTLTVPVVEVVLRAPVEQLLTRWRTRFESPDAHRIYRTFNPDNAGQLLGTDYEPLLQPNAVIEVDASDLERLDPGEIARQVQQLVSQMQDALTARGDAGLPLDGHNRDPHRPQRVP